MMKRVEFQIIDLRQKIWMKFWILKANFLSWGMKIKKIYGYI